MSVNVEKNRLFTKPLPMTKGISTVKQPAVSAFQKSAEDGDEVTDDTEGVRLFSVKEETLSYDEIREQLEQSQREEDIDCAESDRNRQSANGRRLSGAARLSGKGLASVKRAPPVSVGPAGLVQAERGLIGAIMRDNGLYDIVVSQLTKEDFSDVTVLRIFEAIEDILEGRIPNITVAEPFTIFSCKGVSRAASMQKLQSWAQDAEINIDKVSSRARLVHEEAIQRRMALAISTANDVLAQESTVHEKANQLASILETGKGEITKTEVYSAGYFAVNAVTKLAEQARAGKQITGLPMGFADIDMVLSGLQPGQLIVCAARPGVGKTAFALSAFLNIAKSGYPGLFVSLEMPGEELAKRSISHLSGVDAHKLRMAALSAEEWERTIDAAEQLQKLPMTFNDTTTVSLSSLRTLARKEHKAGKLAVLFVDYLQIMDANPKLSREQQISEISRGLKKLAMELKIPIVVLSQLNRDIEKRVNRRPMLSDLRESGAIEQDADVILFIDRDVEGKNPLTADAATIIIGKQRSGRLADIGVFFDKSTTLFHEGVKKMTVQLAGI